MKCVGVPSYPVSIFIAGDALIATMAVRAFCGHNPLCVTVTETIYCYTGGDEPGVIVGLINSPRFPASPAEIWGKAEELAAYLRDELRQESYTIQAPDKTVWLSYREQDR